jgi:bacteriorhodopsin
MKKLKLFITSILTILAMSPIATPVLVRANVAENLNCGAAGSLDGSNCGSVTDGASRINDTVTNVIVFFQVVVGLISVFFIIYGGLRYITSGGETGAVKSAKNTILYAILGLVIVLIAQFIVQFVLNRFA